MSFLDKDVVLTTQEAIKYLKISKPCRKEREQDWVYQPFMALLSRVGEICGSIAS